MDSASWCHGALPATQTTDFIRALWTLMHVATQLLQDAPADVPLVLGFGIAFDSLYRRDGLKTIDDRFVEFLQRRNLELHDRLAAARAAPDAAVGKMEKDLVVDLAPVLDDFTAELFGIAPEVKALRARDQALAPIYSVKRQFVQRRAAKKFTPVQAESFDGDALREQLERHLGGELTELRFQKKSNPGWALKPRTPRPSMSLPAMPPGRHTARRANAGTGTAYCSRFRTRSSRNTWCRLRPQQSVASLRCAFHKRGCANAKVLR
jgi:hypothetical protein